MIDFIIMTNNKKEYGVIKDNIEKVCMNYDYSYMIHHNRHLSNDFKIYIAYINNMNDSTLKELIKIREKENDWTSIIIIVTESSDLITKLYGKGLFLLDIIEKNQYYENRIKKAINIGIRNYDDKPKCMKFSYKNIMYNIPLKNILYIQKVPEEKKCYIYTETNQYEISGCLSKIESKIDSRFIKCSRSCIINTEKVIKYNKKENLITLNNNIIIDDISRDKKNHIIQRLRRVE